MEFSNYSVNLFLKESSVADILLIEEILVMFLDEYISTRRRSLGSHMPFDDRVDPCITPEERFAAE